MSFSKKQNPTEKVTTLFKAFEQAWEQQFSTFKTDFVQKHNKKTLPFAVHSARGLQDWDMNMFQHLADVTIQGFNTLEKAVLNDDLHSEIELILLDELKEDGEHLREISQKVLWKHVAPAAVDMGKFAHLMGGAINDTHEQPKGSTVFKSQESPSQEDVSIMAKLLQTSNKDLGKVVLAQYEKKCRDVLDLFKSFLKGIEEDLKKTHYVEASVFLEDGNAKVTELKVLYSKKVKRLSKKIETLMADVPSKQSFVLELFAEQTTYSQWYFIKVLQDELHKVLWSAESMISMNSGNR